MLRKLEIRNYKSIWEASVSLAPFTLLLGANGTGKSNFLSLLSNLSSEKEYAVDTQIDAHHGDPYDVVTEFRLDLPKHFSFLEEDQIIIISTSDDDQCTIENQVSGCEKDVDPSELSEMDSSQESYSGPVNIYGYPPLLPELFNVKLFKINPFLAGKSEPLVLKPVVHEDGSGVVQVLDSLKTGDREDLFLIIEKRLKEYIPEIEKISFISEKDAKKLQVREKYIPKPVPVEILSEGTQLVLTILTILYQEHPPSLVCIEDIDRGLHPRLFQQIVELCNDLSRKLNIQIIATTHNPYILDEFVGNESAVVIVEKKEGCTTFTTLAERLAQVQDNGEEMPLGAVWYSGLVGGVPKR